MILILLATSLLLADTSPLEIQLDTPAPTLKTGKLFRDELDKPLTASWKNVSLRRICRRLQEVREVSILIDRRIDPTQSIAVEFNAVRLETALNTLAAKVNAQVSIVANTVYIGPPASTAKLRTLIAIRFTELQQPALNLPKGRFAQLGDRRTVHWHDLDRPVQIMTQVVNDYGIQVESSESIPHDLWASATLPAINAVEALSLVLIQFDLTFQWSEAAAGLKIVPLPDDVAISRPYTPRGLSAVAAARDWPAKIKGLRAEPQGNRVKVTGTLEQHEALAALLRPPRRGSSPKPTTPPVPLEERVYADLKFSRQPAIVLIRTLEKNGIQFEYDKDQLQQAGIALDKRISMNLSKPSAVEILTEFCKLLELKYEIDGLTVHLKPR